MIKKFLTSPITIFISMILGVIVGLYAKNIIYILSIINNMYISLLTMTSLPIIICTITINIGKIFNKNFKSVLGLLLILSLLIVTLSAGLGIGICMGSKDMIKPDNDKIIALTKISDRKSNKNVVDYFDKLSLYGKNDVTNDEDFLLKDFLLNIIPNNIFTSMTEDQMMQVVVFFIIFGSMLAFIDKKLSRPIINAFEGVYRALYSFLNQVLLFLPFSVFMTMALLFEDSEMIELFSLLSTVMMIIYISLIIIIVISFLVIWKYTKSDIKTHLRAIKRTVFVAAGTGSRAATITVTMKDVIDLGLEKSTVESIIPINTLLCPVGTIIQATIITVYISIMYDLKINFNVIAVMIIGAVFFSISISNVTSIVAAAMLGVMLGPLGLPTDIGAVIWVIMDMFCEEIETFCGIYSNLAVVTVIDHKLRLNRLKGHV